MIDMKTFKEGFLIGGGLIFTGLALQLCVGPMEWEAFAWPVNGIVLAGFLVMLTTMVYLRKKVYAFQWMSTYQAAIPAMVYAVVMTIIMGLMRQQVNGTWLTICCRSGRSYLSMCISLSSLDLLSTEDYVK